MVVQYPLCIFNIYLVGNQDALISCSVNLKFGQNKLGHWVKLKKYIVGTLEATFLAQLTPVFLDKILKYLNFGPLGS